MRMTKDDFPIGTNIWREKVNQKTVAVVMDYSGIAPEMLVNTAQDALDHVEMDRYVIALQGGELFDTAQQLQNEIDSMCNQVFVF